MDKRTTIVVKEENWKRYEKLAGRKMTEGRGSLSFTSYVNACLSLLSDVTLDQIIEELKRRKKK